MNKTDFDLSTLLPGFSIGLNSSIGISNLVMWILIGIAVIFLCYALCSFVSAKNKIKFYKKLIINIDKNDLVKKQRDLQQNAKKNKSYAGLWLEFDKSLVKSKSLGVNHLSITLDSSHFFNATTLASSLTQNRLLAAVPGFLTAIGVIGTFVGLQLALSQLQLQQNAGVDELRDGIGSLINGASIAFMTSIWGVGTSLVFNISEKWLERIVRENIHELQNKIDFLFPRVNAEQSLVNIDYHSQSADETLKGLAEKIGDKLQEALHETTSSIQRGLENSLNQIMVPAIQSLVDNANQGSEQALESLLTQFMGGIGEAGNSQRLMMEQASANMKQSVNDMGTQMQGFIKQLEQHQDTDKKTAEMQQKSSEKQFDQFNQLIESFKLIAAENSKASQSVLQSSQQMNSVSNQLGILSSNVKEAAAAISEPVEKMMYSNQQIATENKLVFEQSKNLIANLNQTNEQFKHVSDTLWKATKHAESGFTAIDQHLDSFKEGLKSHITDLEKELSGLLKNYSDKVQNQTDAHLNEWNKQTREYTTIMKDVVETMAMVVDEIETKSERNYA